MQANTTQANRLSESSNRERTDLLTTDPTLIGLKSRNRSAAVHLEAALIAIDRGDDDVAAEIFLKSAAELVEDVDASPFQEASVLEQASAADVDEAIPAPDYPHGVTD